MCPFSSRGRPPRVVRTRPGLGDPVGRRVAPPVYRRAPARPALPPHPHAVKIMQVPSRSESPVASPRVCAVDAYLSGLDNTAMSLRLILLDDAFAKVDEPSPQSTTTTSSEPVFPHG
jgi:hypothetical protein